MSDYGSASEHSSILKKPVTKQDRADRHGRANVPWISGVSLRSGQQVRLLNISRTGMLIESGSKLPPESVKELRLCGPDTEIVVPANFVRSDIADVNGFGVKYHIAVTFDEPLPIDTDRNGEEDPLPSVAELRARVGEEIDKVAVAIQGSPEWIERATENQLDRLASLLTEVNRLKGIVENQEPR